MVDAGRTAVSAGRETNSYDLAVAVIVTWNPQAWDFAFGEYDQFVADARTGTVQDQ